MDAFIGGICGSKLTVIKATYRMQIFDLSAVTQFILLFRKQYWKSKIMVMNNKGTNAYTIRNFRRVEKNAYTRIACVHFASALFAYLRAALYKQCYGLCIRVKYMRFPAVSVIKYRVLHSCDTHTFLHESHMRNIKSTSSNFRPCLLTDQLTLTI